MQCEQRALCFRRVATPLHPPITSSVAAASLPAPPCRCVLDAMFDDRFRLKPAFLHNEAALRRRLRCARAG